MCLLGSSLEHLLRALLSGFCILGVIVIRDLMLKYLLILIYYHRSKSKG